MRQARTRREVRRAATACLLASWIEARAYIVFERSGDFVPELRALVAEAERCAKEVDVRWDYERLVPEHIRERLAWADEDDDEGV